MDRKQALTRIVELAMRWQASCNWSAGFKSADSFRKHREQSEMDGEVVWKCQRKIDELTTRLKSRRLSKDERTELKAELASKQAFAGSETFEGFKHGSERHEELSEEYHSLVIESNSEFIELENLLRQFAPTLLQYVPETHFFEACPDDFSSQTREMKTLEGAVRAMMTSPAETLPFKLRRCDVSQTLKRDGFSETITIKNEQQWAVMEAALKSCPHAVAESTLKRIFDGGGPHDRDNVPKLLRSTLNTLHLTLTKWTLSEWDGTR